MNKEILAPISNWFAFPGPLPRIISPANRKHIIVVGAGIAGLVAAYELLAAGHEVSVLEASSRIGGRILTADFGDGLRGELGPMRIPQSHQTVLHYCRHFGLPLKPFLNVNGRAWFMVRGRKWRILEPAPGIFSELTGASAQSAYPFKLLEQAMRAIASSLTCEEVDELITDRIRSPNVIRLDNMTLKQLLCEHLSLQQVELVLACTSLRQYQHLSAKAVFIDWLGLFDSAHFSISGGFDRLPASFAAAIGPQKVFTGHRVIAINLDTNGAHLVTSGSTGERQFSADAVIVAIPARATADIAFTPALPSDVLEAFRNLTYVSSHKSLIRFSKRFWELDDRIAGGGSFTDLPIQSVWYPQDNMSIQPGGPRGTPNIGIPADIEISHSPGILTASYGWNANTRSYASRNQSDRLMLLLRHLSQLHSRDVQPLIEDFKDIVWEQHCGLASGGFAFFSPGEHGLYQSKFVRPYYNHALEMRIAFAGEHLAVAHAWIQAAMQSGLAAARQLAGETAIQREVA